MKIWKFDIGEYAVINEKAKNGLPFDVGKIVMIVDFVTNGSYDYYIEIDDHGISKVKEEELNRLPKEIVDLHLSIKEYKQAIYKPTSENVKPIGADYLNGQIEIEFQDGAMQVVGIETLRKIDEEKEEKIDRKSWDQYFMDIAEMVATRATCDRLHVGCVIVKDKRIVSTGYNGSISGEPHCNEIGHLYNDQERCIRTIHAEQNAILYANRDDLKGATAYVTHQPCENCAKLLVQSGVKKIIYKEKYDNKFNNYFMNMVESIHIEGE